MVEACGLGLVRGLVVATSLGSKRLSSVAISSCPKCLANSVGVTPYAVFGCRPFDVLRKLFLCIFWANA